MNMDKYAYHVGQEVTGIITNATKDALYLVLKDGEEKAVIYANDLENAQEDQVLRDSFSEGEEFTALVKQQSRDRKTREPLYVLSKKLYRLRDQIAYFEDLKETQEIIKGQIRRVSDRGIDLYHKEFRMFMPKRFVDLSTEALRKMMGEELEVVVINVNLERLSIIVSSTIAQARKHRLAREAAYEQLSVGDIITGIVAQITEYGAFISFGEITGLLHISELSHKMIRNVTEVLNIGDEVTVKVIKLEDSKISLSKRALEEHPWDILKEQYPVGVIFDGTIVKIIPAGLIIKLTDEYSGLMPRSEYSWQFSDQIEKKYNEGDEIKVKVININDEKHRISLSHRETQENAWGKIKNQRGDIIKVVFEQAEEKGARVSYKGVTGFMPISEVTSLRRINSADEIFKVGETIDVVILDINTFRTKLIVSAKANDIAKEQENFTHFFKQQANEVPTNTLGEALGEAFEQFRKETKSKK